MSDETSLELAVLCATLLIEAAIQPDLTEMLRPYNLMCKVFLLYS